MNIFTTRFLFIVSKIFSSLLCQCSSQKLLVVMLDGFRWDYYDSLQEKLPALTKFISEGVRAEWVEPIFPSETFPSMTTIATGVFPENHGIIANYILDRSAQDDQDKFMLRTTSQRQWMTAEPIWITSTKQNKKAYTCNWIYSNNSYDGILPAKYQLFTGNEEVTDLEKHLNEIEKLLSEDFSLVMLYHSLVDSNGHAAGPFSRETNESVINFDKTLEQFMTKLETSKIGKELNIILLSDHGMTNTNVKNGAIPVRLSDYITMNYVDRIVGSRTLLNIASFPNSTEKLYLELKAMPGADVYKKEEIPDDFHYKKNPFVLDIIVVTKPGYTILSLYGSEKQIPAPDLKCKLCNEVLGDHGYANMTDMRGVFYARGPAFKKGYSHTPIRLEDEYQLFAHVLQIHALSNNGSWSRVVGMLN